MAHKRAPTFLKRQKEQKRAAKATAKRAAQQARRDERAANVRVAESLEEEIAAEILENEGGRSAPAEEDGEPTPR